MGIETAVSPTTIVFDVAGTIYLKSSPILENKSYLTTAGQTAPGKGITLRHHNFSIKNCKHIVVRYSRVRLGDKNKPQGSAPDVMTVNYNDHLILDHLSPSWGVNPYSGKFIVRR